MISILLDKRMKGSDLTQMVDQLKNYHVQSTLDDGALFPDYHAVAVANHLDVLTLKKAYEILVEDGYLKRDGSRYYISRLPFTEMYDGHFNDIYSSFKKLGKTPSFKTLSVEIKDELPSGIDVDESFQNLRYVKIVRVFYADQIPLIHAEAYYDLKMFPDFSDLDLQTMRIFPYLKEKHGRVFSHYNQLIDVVQAPASINEALNQPSDASVFRMRFHIYDQEYQPFEVSIFHTSILYSLESINNLRTMKEAS